MNFIVQKSYLPVLSFRGKFWLGYTLLLLAVVAFTILDLLPL